MWLYVPSTSSPSALEAPVSISASDWRFPALERSAWWRGKPSPSRTWWQRWNRVSYIRRLCGAMPEPSTAAHGVALWTASLAASRASHTALLDESREASTPATSGATPGASSSSLDLGSSSLRTLAGCSRRGLTKSLEPSGYGETFASLVSRLRSDSSRRRKSARAMSANASSSSAWPTMRAHSLRHQADRWSTPRSSDGEKGGPNQAFGTGGIPLPAQVSQWATPQGREVGQWQYANVQQTKQTLTLTGQTMKWSTPSIADVDGGRMSRSGERSSELLMKGQAEALFSRLDQTPSTFGGSLPTTLLTFYRRMRATTDSELRSEMRALLRMAIRQRGRGWTRKGPTGYVRPSFKRSLNPCFVGWLMGWPPIASTGFGFSGTEWSLWRQRMRCALSQLALPAEAPPAQLALFG